MLIYDENFLSFTHNVIRYRRPACSMPMSSVTSWHECTMVAKWDHLLVSSSTLNPHCLTLSSYNSQPTTLNFPTYNAQPLDLQLSTCQSTSLDPRPTMLDFSTYNSQPLNLQLLTFHPITPCSLWSHNISAHMFTILDSSPSLYLYFKYYVLY